MAQWKNKMNNTRTLENIVEANEDPIKENKELSRMNDNAIKERMQKLKNNQNKVKKK